MISRKYICFNHFYFDLENTWNKTDACDTDHKMLTRSKIKVNKKSVSFVDANVDSKICDGTRSPAARSLFSMRCILELPNELVTQIMRYFNSKELMLLRCVSLYIQFCVLCAHSCNVRLNWSHG